MNMNIEFLPVAGDRQARVIEKRGAIKTIRSMIGAPIATDTVNLRDGRVLIVDDTGLLDGRPVNPAATALFRSIYPLAEENKTNIHGDCVIAVDEDFA